MDVPETRYATAPDGVQLAYQRFGQGDVDLVYMPFFLFNIDLFWDFAPMASWLTGLGRFARVIVHDPRGTGLSDRDVEPGDLGTRTTDLLAVLDDAGVARTSVFGARSVGAVAALLAATHPERVASLIWMHAAARDAWAPDYPWGETAEELDAEIEEASRRWGSAGEAEEMAREQGPIGSVDADFQRWLGRITRGTITPRRAASLLRAWYETDVRDILPALSQPVLVIARDPSAEESASVAAMIPGARFVAQPGSDMMPWFGDTAWLLDEIRRFLGAEPAPSPSERFLATVLFTDIVGSTERAAEAGDARWRDLVAEHHRLVRGILARHGGREMDTAGDGFYATFDAPGHAVRCALESGDAIRAIGLEIRAGVHTGEVHLVDGKVGGLAVAIGARVAAQAAPSEVLVSQTVKDLVAGSGLTFEDAGEHELKGVPDRWRLYRVTTPAMPGG
jgi:class 3 adenylate cyclase/pimeloyl-ACP methyl ester carboxylesterase